MHDVLGVYKWNPVMSYPTTIKANRFDVVIVVSVSVATSVVSALWQHWIYLVLEQFFTDIEAYRVEKSLNYTPSTTEFSVSVVISAVNFCSLTTLNVLSTWTMFSLLI